VNMLEGEGVGPFTLGQAPTVVADLTDCTSVVVGVQDDDAVLTGSAARNARKQRLEERESARLQRMSQAVAARRSIDALKDQKKQVEEARVQRVAQKAAARRAARTAAAPAADATEDGLDRDFSREGAGEQKERSEGGGGGGGSGGGRGQEARRETQRGKEWQQGSADQNGEKQREPQQQDKRREKHRERRAHRRHREKHRHEKQKLEIQRKDDQRDDVGIGRQGATSTGEEPEAKKARDHRKAARRQRQKRSLSADENGDAGATSGVVAKQDRGGGGAGDAPREASTSGSQSSSSSSSPSSPSAHAMAIAKALATGAPIPLSAPSKTPCFAWERSLQPTITSGAPTPQSAIFTGPPVVVPLASSTELEQFLSAGGVDGEAAVRLRALPPQLQRMVMDRGPVAGTRNPSSVVISRIKEVEALRLGSPSFAGLVGGLGVPNLGLGAGSSGGGSGPLGASPEIESLISTYSLDTQASAMLRRLSPEQQRLALKLPIQEARNPSAFIMTQLSMPRLLGTGEASRLPTQPHDPTAMMISSMLRF